MSVDGFCFHAMYTYHLGPGSQHCPGFNANWLPSDTGQFGLLRMPCCFTSFDITGYIPTSALSRAISGFLGRSVRFPQHVGAMMPVNMSEDVTFALSYRPRTSLTRAGSDFRVRRQYLVKADSVDVSFDWRHMEPETSTTAREGSSIATAGCSRAFHCA